MEEISLHGKELGKYSNMNHSHLSLGGGGGLECKVESRSLKLLYSTQHIIIRESST